LISSRVASSGAKSTTTCFPDDPSTQLTSKINTIVAHYDDLKTNERNATAAMEEDETTDLVTQGFSNSTYLKDN
jgi:hypothetical protein